MGVHEPYWRTNTITTYSPPSLSRWDFGFSAEELPYYPDDGNALYSSSTSSDSIENDDLFFSSHSDLSQGPRGKPPVVHEITASSYETAARRGQVLWNLPYSPAMEGTSGNLNVGSSGLTHSESSKFEPLFTSCISSHRKFSNRCSFMSKPIHSFLFPSQTSREDSNSVTGLSEFDASPFRRDSHRCSGTNSSVDVADIQDALESESFSRPCVSSSEASRCGVCERFLAKRSPWSSQQIVRNGDMPVAGVLSCCHVFHAECLEQTTPKAQRSDPPCPICVRLVGNSSGQQNFSRLTNRFRKVRTFSEDGPSGSRPWGFVQRGDCVEGALRAPPQDTMLMLDHNRVKKHLSLNSHCSMEFPGKLRKSGTCSSQLSSGESVDLGSIDCSNTKAGLSINWTICMNMDVKFPYLMQGLTLAKLMGNLILFLPSQHQVLER